MSASCSQTIRKRWISAQFAIYFSPEFSSALLFNSAFTAGLQRPETNQLLTSRSKPHD